MSKRLLLIYEYKTSYAILGSFKYRLLYRLVAYVKASPLPLKESLLFYLCIKKNVLFPGSNATDFWETVAQRALFPLEEGKHSVCAHILG